MSPNEPRLLPPGPAAHVRLSPDPIRLWPGGARRVRAIVTHVHGQTIAATTVWTASSPHISIDGEGAVRTIALAELAYARASRDIGHADYRALSGEPGARLRYLVALFAKDVAVVTRTQRTSRCWTG